MVLESKGFGVDVALTGEAAIEQVHNGTYPVAAIVDIGLPDMSGLEVVRRLRAENPKRLPVMIAISGYGEEDDKRAAREAGFDAYLTKPVRVDEVVALLS
jgi:DNA-binding response OmpR family regulator